MLTELKRLKKKKKTRTETGKMGKYVPVILSAFLSFSLSNNFILFLLLTIIYLLLIASLTHGVS